MREIKTVVGKGGRINLPAEQRRILGLVEGDEVVVGVDGDCIRIQTRDSAIDRAQRMVRERLGEGRMPSEELIAERREEALSEWPEDPRPESLVEGVAEGVADGEAEGTGWGVSRDG